MVEVVVTTGTSILSGLINLVIERVTERAHNNSQSKLKNALDKFQITLSSTKGIVIDLEKRKRAYYDDNTRMNDWLTTLQEAIYDADDVLDELEYEKLKTRIKKPSCVTKYLHKYNPIRIFEHDIVAKISEIQDRLDDLLKLANYLKLEVVEDKFISSTNYISYPQRRITTSYFEDEIEIEGRDHIRKEIIKYFIHNSPTTNNGHDIVPSSIKVPILHIVGMGGIGKTTLAQMVYNDEKIKNCFDLRIWICVSDDFSELKIIREILEHIYCASGRKVEDIGNNRNLNTLALQLETELKEKTYLLVLDDVWNEDSSKWERIQKHFKTEPGYERRKILVTTRSDFVTNAMSSSKKIVLQDLEEDVFLPLFNKCAFGNMDKYPPELEKMSNDIAKKLMGSPLAAKTVGRILRSNLNKDYWDYILKSELWSLPQKENDIMPALRLSYQYFPEHLKPCFAFCALYPKDYKYKRREIVHMWVALGYIQTQETGISMEEIGDEYVDELLDRSMFQSDILSFERESNMFQTKTFKIEDDRSFTMHDLIHDLAKMVSANDSMMIQDTCRLQQIPSSVRHLSYFIDDKNWIGDHCFDHLNNLRTVILEIKGSSEDTEKRICTSLQILISKLKFLRILNIRFDCTLEIPFSKNKHLRYIRLNGNDFIITPSSLANLYQLQRLDGQHVYSMRKFPIQNFLSLRLLKCRASSRYGLEGLHVMKEMRELSIEELYKVKIKEQALRAKLNTLHDLTKLTLDWSGDHSQSVNDEEIFAGLEPGPKVAILRINGYRGRNCPEWMENLKLLQDLYMNRCNQLTFISTKGFSRIKRLTFYFCPKVQQIQSGFQGFSVLHSLEVLVVCYCPLLLSVLLTEGTSGGLPSSLKELSIRDSERERVINVSSKILQSLTNLIRLRIHCGKLFMPPSGTNQPNIQQQLQQLKSFYLHCDTAEQLKGWLLHLHGSKSLTHLEWHCYERVSFDAEMKKAVTSFVSLKVHEYDSIHNAIQRRNSWM